MSNFYNFVNKNESEVDLYITGDIIQDNDVWWYKGAIDYCCPKEFREQLEKANGKKLNVIIDSYGGDTDAASVIYSMLRTRSGESVAKVSGMAASAASVIAMGVTKMLMSPTALFMIHNPWTYAAGDADYFKKVIEQLDACTESIVNAYERKTKLSRDEILQLMKDDTFMDVNKAMQLGFCDGVWGDETDGILTDSVALNSIKNQRIAVYNKIKATFKPSIGGAGSQEPPTDPPKQDAAQPAHTEDEIRKLELSRRLALLKRF